MRRAGSAAAVAALALVLLGGCGDPPSEVAGEGGSPTPTAARTTGADLPDRPRRPRSSAPADAPQAPEDESTRNPLAEAVEGIAPFVDEPVLGADISWPQCPLGMGIPLKRSKGAPPPVEEAQYVVLGLTNGPGFYPNPCLAEQVDDVEARGRLAAAYSVVSYPEPERLARHADDGPFDAGTRLGALANNGYAQAEFNVRTMRSAGLLTPVVWIDVEPVPDFEWSADLVANAAVVEGMARGYRDAGYAIGVYSTPYLWDVVVGDLSLGVPEWRAAGQTSREAALATCAPDRTIQGGEAVMGQWVEAERDMNVTCPGISLELERWFHRY